MHRGQSSGNYSNSLDDLDRELALLRQKRELLEGQQNRLRGSRGRGQGGGRGSGQGGGRGRGGGGGGSGIHQISPWDNNASIRPLFNNSSDFNPQNSGGSGFNYTNLYDSAPRDQYQQPRRNDSRKRSEPNNWSDRPNNNQARQPPRKRTRPNPPAEQQRFQSGPRTPNNYAGPASNPNSLREQPNKNNRPPVKRNFRPRTSNEQPMQQGNDDILRADVEPHPRVRGRMEHALGVILQDMKSNFPDKHALFRDPLPCRTIKQMLRDRIKGLLLGKQVGQPNEIVLVYRQSFPHDDDIIKAVNSLISTTAHKVASNFDTKVKTEDTARPAAKAAAAKPKRSEAVTVAKQNSGPAAVKPSQIHMRPNKPTPKRNPEADVILGHFKENLPWAIDTELKLMFDNLKDLYKDQSPSDENIKDSIKKIIVIQRARFEEKLKNPSVSIDKAENPKVEEPKADASVDYNKTNESDKSETTEDKDPKTAENGEAQDKNVEGQAEKELIRPENGQDVSEEAIGKEMELKRNATEIQKLCNFVLGIWLFKHLPVLLPKFRETIAKMVRTSLFERVQEETGNKEIPIPARATASTQSSDQRYYVSVVGRPKLPKRAKLSAFLWRYNPCSVKRHKSIFNLLFVGFSNKEDYDNILEKSVMTFGTVQVFIKPSKARPTNDENNKLVNSASNGDNNDDIVMIEDRQGTNKPDQQEEREANTKTDEAVDYSEDAIPDAIQKDDAKKTEAPITNEDAINNDEKADEEKDNFLDSMLDGAIVLDSVGADEDEFMFTENPDEDSQINIHVDLDETVILADDDSKQTQEPDKAIESVQEDNKQGEHGDLKKEGDEKKECEEKKEGDEKKECEEKKEGDEKNDGDEKKECDEKKEDISQQETPDDKATGVTTRRSTRLNN